MQWHPEDYPYIKKLTPEYERIIRRIPFLNIDSLLIPSPYILDKAIDVDYDHSLVWEEKGEILGYLLIYATPDQKKFQIYRQVTSPFGRGKGIGSAFVLHLAHHVDPDAHIYLYVWDKLISSVDFFLSRGFKIEDLIVYRKMKFHLMSVRARTIRERGLAPKRKELPAVEELSKVRHDAKKSVKVLFDMVAMLSLDNFNKMTEDINRETTALLNTLNMYEDRISTSRKVSIKELVTERVIPYVEAADSGCEVRLVFKSKIPPVAGSYLSYSRALINLVSNAVDAIKATRRPGVIEITLGQEEERVILSVEDNGVGIPEEKLKKGADNVPLFVGHTTKGDQSGEGIGTKQIYAAFGAANITVESRENEWTRWTVSLPKSSGRDSALLADLQSKYVRFIKSTQKIPLTKDSSRRDIAIFIWQLRQMEIFSYDLVYYFSRYNNVRDIFQNILLYRFDGKSFDYLKTELRKCRIEHDVIRSWLLGVTKRINRNESYLRENIAFHEYKGVLFESYSQAIDRTMIFTLDPYSGEFFVSDRKLAEHLDFVPYLNRDKEELLRGEFLGDVKQVESPIYLGVWSVKNREDLHQKLKLIQRGADQLIAMGLGREKRLAFYNTTFNTCDWEIDTLKVVTLGEMAGYNDEELDRLVRPADNEMSGLILAT